MGVLVLAPWGDPRNWFYARYKLDGGDSDYVESFTSLSLIASVLKGFGGRSVVLGLDTVGFNRGKPGSYRELVEWAREEYERYLCGVGASVWILPGTIYLYRDGLKLSGAVGDYYYTLIARLSLHLFGTERNGAVEEPPEAFAVDLSHGINYMPVYTLMAAREIAGLSALVRTAMGVEGRHGMGAVELRAYNSDPIVRGPPEARRSPEDPCTPAGRDIEPALLEVHLTEKSVISSSFVVGMADEIFRVTRDRIRGRAAWNLALRGVNAGEVLSSEEREMLNNALRMSAILLAFYRLGLVPELLQYVWENSGVRSSIAEAIRFVLEKHKGSVIVEGENGEYTLRRALRLGPGMRLLSYGLAVATATVQALDNGGGPTLKAVDTLRETLRGSRITYTIQLREREKLDKALKIFKNIRHYGRISLAQLYCAQPREYSENVFIRDLIAHGGWHTDLVELEKNQEGRILIRVNLNETPTRSKSPLTDLIISYITSS